MQKDINYILAGFEKTITERFPQQAAALEQALQARLSALYAENADASREKKRHLERQILPGIAAYETLQAVMPKEEAYQTVHAYVEVHAREARKSIEKAIRFPGLYRLVPGAFCLFTHRLFNEAAGFAAVEHQTSGGVWRVDMTKCPYHDTCVRYGCPELCPCFCDSDDIAYDHLHPKLLWHRTKTLGRGDDCCDFCLRRRDKA